MSTKIVVNEEWYLRISTISYLRQQAGSFAFYWFSLGPPGQVKLTASTFSPFDSYVALPSRPLNRRYHLVLPENGETCAHNKIMTIENLVSKQKKY